MPRTPVTGVVRNVPVTTKMTRREADATEKQAGQRGFSDRSAYIRWLVHHDAASITKEAAAS